MAISTRDTEVGMRVGAISHTADGKFFLYGYGVYEGDFPLPGSELYRERFINNYLADHPDAVRSNVEVAVDRLMSNPRIKLDNGKTVWGAQCWWAAEEQIKARIGDAEVVIVEPEQLAEPAKQETSANAAGQPA